MSVFEALSKAKGGVNFFQKNKDSNQLTMKIRKTIFIRKSGMNLSTVLLVLTLLITYMAYCYEEFCSLGGGGGQSQIFNLGWAREEHFLIFLLLFFPVFPQFFHIFFFNLVLWVGSSPTWEGPGYVTGPWSENTHGKSIWSCHLWSKLQPRCQTVKK